MRIIDGHVHVSSTHFIPQRFIEDVAANMYTKFAAYGSFVSRNRYIELVCNQHQDHFADELVTEMDSAGIEKAVLLIPDFTQSMPMQRDIYEMARLHDEIRKRHPDRFFIFVGIDPRKGLEGVDTFEKCIDDFKCEGLKLYPPCGYSPDDPALYPYYEICAARRLPVLIHIGPTAQSLQFRYAIPELVDAAARSFSDVNFILAHGAVNYADRCVPLCAQHANVYLDIGGFTGAIQPGGWQAHLKLMLNQGLNHKIIFGTDWPIFKMSGGLKALVSEFVAESGPLVGISEVEKDQLMSGNILRLLGL